MFVFFIFTNIAFASRTAPVNIEPIYYDNIKIVPINDFKDEMGIIRAFDKDTNNLLWEKRLYKVRIKNNLEEDVQLVFFKEVKIENDKIIAINEKDTIFVLNPRNGKILNYNYTGRILCCILLIILLIGVILLKSKKK